jgi:hypothetical protein
MSDFSHLLDAPPFDPSAITLKKKEPEPELEPDMQELREVPAMPEDTVEELKDKIRRLEEECLRMKSKYESEGDGIVKAGKSLA